MKYITTLLVDDDYLVLQDLQKLVDWNSLGFQIIGTAANGKTALSLTQKKQPELIITDISMPVMDGFDFIETVQKTYPEIYIVFISSYADFDYAKRAMKDGIRDYILKNELTRDTLTEQLLQIRELLLTRKDTRHQDLRLRLTEYFQSSQDEPSLPESLAHRRYIFYFFSFRLPMEKLKPHFQRINRCGEELFQLCRQEISSRYPDSVVFYVDDLMITGLSPKSLGAAFSESAVSRTCRTLLAPMRARTGQEILGAWIPEKLTLTHCRDMYRRLLPLLHFQNSFPAEHKSNLNYYTDHPLVPVQQIFPYHLLGTSIQHPERFYEQLEAFLTLLFDARDADSLFMLYHNLLLQIEELSNHMMTLSGFSYFQDRPELSAFLHTSYEELRSFLMKTGQGNYSPALTTAMEYMKHNYSDSSLTIEQIASAAYLSSSRLSVLFKQETGQTVNDFLTDLRISQAIHLLENSSYKIYEIAEKVGYKSSQYFSQIFSQRTGHKPLHFRQKKPVV